MNICHQTIKMNWWERVKSGEIGATHVDIWRGNGPCEFGERIPFVFVPFPVFLFKFLFSSQKHQRSQHVGHRVSDRIYSAGIPSVAGLGTQPSLWNRQFHPITKRNRYHWTGGCNQWECKSRLTWINYGNNTHGVLNTCVSLALFLFKMYTHLYLYTEIVNASTPIPLSIRFK